MLAIDDEGLLRAVLDYFVRLLSEGELQVLLDAGLSAEQLDRLRTLSVRDALQLVDLDLGCSIHVDGRQFGKALCQYSDLLITKTRIEYYVQHRAPASLMLQLFHVGNVELRDMRAALCPSDKAPGSGRPEMPTADEERERIHLAWVEIFEAPAIDERDRYISLHKKFPNYTIAALHAVVHEFDDNPPASSPGKSSRPEKQ